MFASIKSKIIALNMIVLLVTSSMAVILTAWQSKSLDSLMEKELAVQNRQQLEAIAKDVFYMCRAQDEALRQKLEADMNVTLSMAESQGGLSLGTEIFEWEAINQASKEKRKAVLPQMLLGGLPLKQNFNKSIESPLVDPIEKLTGSTCTIFQRMNKDGDMLRVCTNVEAADGRRAIGTFIPAFLESAGGRDSESHSQACLGREKLCRLGICRQ